MVQEQEGPAKPARVLLVQSDARAAMRTSEMLRAAWTGGLVVIHAQEIDEAVHELLEHRVTCVLLDTAGRPAPIMALEQLAAAALDTPIIALSDQADEQLGLSALRAGAQDHLLQGELTAAGLARSVLYAMERKRSVAALAVQALHDPLTTLPNRALFVDRLRGALDRSRRTRAPVAVLFLDVDDFKLINDSYGHAAGDQLMTLLAQRFRGLLRPMDTVARFGGDEFTFLLEGLEGEADAGRVADRVRRSAQQPLELAHGPITVSVSIGVSVVADPDAAVDEIIRRADSAMYRAKEFGGARIELAGEPGSQPDDPIGEGGAPPSSELEQALAGAVERSELRVHYQPRVSLDGRTDLVGFEALVRWEHPERGLMEPVEFIGLAEQSGLIGPIGDWVLDQALHQVSRWRQSHPGVTISVNLSGRQLEDPGLPGRLSTAMREAGHDPSVLCLEVPEGALRDEPEAASRQLTVLHDMGVKLAIDDFGTGESSAGDLAPLPVQIIKIDRTLVSRLGHGAGDAGDVGALVELGHQLGLCVVAEGVETDAQLARLRELGCDGAQGYLFSQPMPGDTVLRLLTDG